MSPRQFHVLFDSLFRVLFNFPSRYLFAIGLVVIFSFRRSLPPTLCCTIKQHDSMERSSSHPSLQSQSLSRSYGSNLPTSLTYINLSTRDSKPWRPAADSVQAVGSLRAPVFDFQGPRREYRHSNLIPCSTSLSNHISL